MRRVTLLVGAVLIGLTSCDSPVARTPDADASALAAKGGATVTVPIHGWQSMAPAPDAVPVHCGYGVYLPNRYLATGVLSHLGKTSSVLEGSACWVLGPDAVGVAGSARHTAANGDELHASWTGANRGGMLELAITFVGGTGRFAGASGTARLLGTVDPVTGTGEYEIVEGRLTLPSH